jgi:hypothetical protein
MHLIYSFCDERVVEDYIHIPFSDIYLVHVDGREEVLKHGRHELEMFFFTAKVVENEL